MTDIAINVLAGVGAGFVTYHAARIARIAYIVAWHGKRHSFELLSPSGRVLIGLDAAHLCDEGHGWIVYCVVDDVLRDTAHVEPNDSEGCQYQIIKFTRKHLDAVGFDEDGMTAFLDDEAKMLLAVGNN